MSKPIVIVGGGFGGTSVAREIRRRDLGDVIVIEKGRKLGEHASGRNTGVGHAGFNYPPDTVKAKFCVEGNRRIREVCQHHEVPFDSCGTLVVAQDSDEVNQLETYLGYGMATGVPGIDIIGREELREREPHARGIKALFAPSGFIVDSRSLLEALAQEAQASGAQYFADTEVVGIEGQRLITTKGDFEASFIVNCGGLQVDKIAHMMGGGLEYSVIPITGHYKRSSNLLVYSMIYPVKNERFPHLGVHVTRTIDGYVIAGPTATLSFSGREGYTKNLTLQGITELVKDSTIRKWVAEALRDPLTRQEVFYNIGLSLPFIGNRAFQRAIKHIYDGEIHPGDLEPHRPGVRAQLVEIKTGKMVEDFRAVEGKYSVSMMNLNSPGMSSCLAVAPDFVGRYVEPRIK